MRGYAVMMNTIYRHPVNSQWAEYTDVPLSGFFLVCGYGFLKSRL